MDQCEAIVILRTDERNGAIFRCTKRLGHSAGHEYVGPAQDWPEVEGAPIRSVTVGWFTDD